MIILAKKYLVTISPDPKFWVRSHKCKFGQLMYNDRANEITKAIRYVMSNQGCAVEYYAQMHFELSKKNRNFHCHGVIYCDKPINVDEFIDVVGHRLSNYPQYAVKVETEFVKKEGSEFGSWEEYCKKDSEIAPYPMWFRWHHPNEKIRKKLLKLFNVTPDNIAAVRESLINKSPQPTFC